jgi:uncharacterized delta-60 repeat protein
MRTIITSIAFLYCFFASSQNIFLNPNFGYEGFTYAENTSEINKIALNPDGSIISAGRKFISGGSNIVLTKHDAIGTQDLTFGTGGVALNTDFNSVDLRDLQLQADGKILLAGSNYTGFDNGPGGSPIIHAFVMRYHPNGVIDSSFATNGVFEVTDYNQSEFNAVLVQSDQSLRLISFSDGITYITKLTSAGTLDNSFGTNGSRAISDLSTFFFFNRGAITLNDGSILSYGLDDTGFTGSKLTCVKINASGDFITSFGQNGISSFDMDSDPNTLELVTKAQELSDGKIVLSGRPGTGYVLIRLKADGIADSAFATNGILVNVLPHTDMVVQPTGKILIGGNKQVSQFDWGLTVSRYNADGTIDNSFNTTGTFDCDFSAGFESLQCMVLTSPDYLLVGGKTTYIDEFSDFLLAELDMSEFLGLTGNKSEVLSIYPNPFSDNVTVSIENESVTEIQLADATGRIIKNYLVGKNTVLSLEHLEAGIYYFVFKNNRQEVVSQKLIKQ